MKQKRPVNGMALIMTLGFTVLIVMMLTATMTGVHGGNIFAQDYHRKAAALYAAESGLAYVQEELENNWDWETGFVDRPTAFGTGTVTVRFGPSVNNLNNLTPASGPYGPVPPQTAFIRVEGRALGRTEVIECLIGRKSENFIRAALIATGKIYLDGNVNIAGRISSDDLGLAEADLVSNYDQDSPWGNGVPPVYWAGSPSPTDELRGTIRSASPSSNAISPNLVAISSQALTDHAPVAGKNVNIRRAVQSKSGVSASIPTTPTAPLSGEYYASGSTTVVGDLILDNASLYVNNDFTVLGSIRGRGAVYVVGDTRFSGDAEVISNEDGVVIYSQGNVHLTGFGGMEWMDNVAAMAGMAEQWDDTKRCLNLLQDHLNAYAEGDTTGVIPPPTTPPPGAAALDYYWASQAGVVLANLAYPLDASYRPSGITHNDLLHQMWQLVDAQTPGTSRDFMLKKLSYLREPVLGDEHHPNNILGALGINRGGAGTFLVDDFLVTGQTQRAGLQVELFLTAALLNGETMGSANFSNYSGLTPQHIREALTKHTHWLDFYSYDQLGSSYFQGNVYTRGAIYAANEITIIGSLSAIRDPDEPNTVWTVPDSGGVSLRPGDVYLGRGTRILHLDELEPGWRFSNPSAGVSHWLR